MPIKSKKTKFTRLKSFSAKKRLTILAFALVFGGIGSYFLITSFALTSQGTYTNWFWNPPSIGFGSLQHELLIEDVTPGASYFWSHQFKFVNGDGGYMGLQSNGNRVNGTKGKTAIFSIFSAGIEGSKASCVVQQSGFDGYNTSGTSCRIPYEWVLGRKYKIRTAQFGRDADGSWWIASVTDETTGIETYIAKIKTPPAWKGLSNWSTMWTEYFGPKLSSCSNLPYSRVRFYRPSANNGTVVPASHSNKLTTTADCKTSSVNDSIGGFTVQVMGNR